MKRWCSGRVLGFRPKKCWFTLNLCSSIYSSHGASSVKLRILECFTLYLPSGHRLRGHRELHLCPALYKRNQRPVETSVV